MTKDEMKKLLTDDLKKMSSMDVTEYTLYRKWESINGEKWAREDHQRNWELKQSLWMPTKPDDYLNLEPQVIPVEGEKNSTTWNILRTFVSSAHWNQSPGRFARFLVRDKKTMSYLGIISIGSDFISLGGRDKFISWTMQNKMESHMLNHTCMGSSIVPTQPLGYSYTGGKLISLLTCSGVVEDYWNHRYDEKLVGVSTTSLYGGLSQYNRLKFWHKCDSTTGKIPIEPSEEVYDQIREWVKVEYPEKYREMTTHVNQDAIISHSKQRILNYAYKMLGVKAIENEFSRGVYFCPLYDNFKEFLSGKDTTLGKKLFDNSVKTLVDMWKERYAKKRVQSLIEQDRYSTESLFYDDIIGANWNDVKEKYLSDVGR